LFYRFATKEKVILSCERRYFSAAAVKSPSTP
jgi:hypothetical protein